MPTLATIQHSFKSPSTALRDEKEIKVMIAKMFKNIENRIEKMQEIFNRFNKDIKEIKKKQTVMNSITTEIKNTLEGIDSRITEAEEWFQ